MAFVISRFLEAQIWEPLLLKEEDLIIVTAYFAANRASVSKKGTYNASATGTLHGILPYKIHLFVFEARPGLAPSHITELLPSYGTAGPLRSTDQGLVGDFFWRQTLRTSRVRSVFIQRIIALVYFCCQLRVFYSTNLLCFIKDPVSAFALDLPKRSVRQLCRDQAIVWSHLTHTVDRGCERQTELFRGNGNSGSFLSVSFHHRVFRAAAPPPASFRICSPLEWHGRQEY